MVVYLLKSSSAPTVSVVSEYAVAIVHLNLSLSYRRKLSDRSNFMGKAL